MLCLQLWQCGLTYTAEVVLEGLARAGARGKCTVMGRSAMSLDLQGLQRGLQGIVAGKQEMAINALRVVDAFIKAYYIPWGQELHRWAITHPEYKQVIACSPTIALKVIDTALNLRDMLASRQEIHFQCNRLIFPKRIGLSTVHLEQHIRMFQVICKLQ